MARRWSSRSHKPRADLRLRHRCSDQVPGTTGRLAAHYSRGPGAGEQRADHHSREIAANVPWILLGVDPGTPRRRSREGLGSACRMINPTSEPTCPTNEGLEVAPTGFFSICRSSTDDQERELS